MVSKRTIALIQKILLIIGLAGGLVGLTADRLGIGIKGHGLGPGQISIIFLGVGIAAWSIILLFKQPVKRFIYSFVLAILLFLLWRFWFYPILNWGLWSYPNIRYGLNLNHPAPFAYKIVVISHLLTFFLLILAIGIALWDLSYNFLKIQNISKKLNNSKDRGFVSRKESSSIDKKTVVLFAILITALMICCCFFTYPVETADDLSLYNPIYVYLEHGKMAYPAFSHFDAMFAHPPLRYLNIAWLMKLGFNSFYATVLPGFLFFLAGVFFIITGQFQSREKIALLFGIFAPLLLIPEPTLIQCSSIRPDISLALGWFAGLIALQAARIEGWNPRKLFIGAFFLTFTSGLHYFAWVAWMGIFVYIIYALRDLGMKCGFEKVLIILFGICCVMIPYITLFVGPQFDNILNFVQSVQGDGGVLEALSRHVDQYISNQHMFPDSRSPYLVMFFRPIWILGFPLALFAWVFLAFPGNTRSLAFSGSFLPLFVCLYSQGKSYWYYMPENMIYLTGISLLFLFIVQSVASWIFPAKLAQYALPLAACCLIIICIKGNIYLERTNITKQPYRHEMHLARACAKDLIGNDAIVAGRLDLWYVSGAEHWYDIHRDLLWEKDIARIDLPSYFSQFDAIVDEQHMAHVTNNNLNATLSSWYVDGVLHLRGWYFTNSGPGLNVLIFSGQDNKEQKLLGYGLYQRDTLYRFDKAAHGDYVFVSLIGSTSGQHTALKADSLFYNAIPLPNNRSLLEEESLDLTDIKKQIHTFLLPQKTYKNIMANLGQSILIRDEIRCKMVPIEPNVLLEKLKRDHPITFYRSIEELPVKVSRREET